MSSVRIWHPTRMQGIRVAVCIVGCITVGGSRNGPSPTTNFIPKSKVGLAASVLIHINRYFV